MTVPVVLTIGNSAGGSLSNIAGQLAFVYGGSPNPLPPRQSIQISNGGTGSLNWTLTATTFNGGGWLATSAQSGTAPSAVDVIVSPQNLAAGSYSGQVVVQ